MSQSIPEGVQSSQAPPELPHCVSRKPAWQTPLGSQQPAQDCPAHASLGTHPPPLHDALWSVQSTHAAPPAPHAPSNDPPVQTPAEQQPLGQLRASQGGGGGSLHEPARHTRPVATQLSHARAFAPHAVSDPPLEHVPAAQQPCGHVLSVHVDGPSQPSPPPSQVPPSAFDRASARLFASRSGPPSAASFQPSTTPGPSRLVRPQATIVITETASAMRNREGRKNRSYR